MSTPPQNAFATSSEPQSGQAAWIGTGILALLAVLGVALRLRQYWFNRSLWVDEAAFALNVINSDLASLLSDQSAPPGFLLAAFLAVAAFGPSELALRLTPLIAGILTIPVALVLAGHELRSMVARITFVGLVSLSPVLIFYSSEFKPYSSDALAALGILVAVSYRNSRYGLRLLLIVGLVAVLCSFPASFVAAPAGLLILYEAVRSARWWQAIAVGVAWSAGAALHAAYVLSSGVDREFMVDYWGRWGSFAPLPHSFSELLWYPLSLSRLTFIAFRDLDQATPGVEAGWYDPLGWSLAVAFVCALAVVIAARRWTAIVAAGAILTTYVASALQIYPFCCRFLIFLVPLTLFVIAAGIDELCRFGGRIMAGIGAVLLLSVGVPSAAEVAMRPRSTSDMRGALEKVRLGFQDGDAIVVWSSSKVFKYYVRHRSRHGDKRRGRRIPLLYLRETDPANKLIDAAEANGCRRVWFVAAHKIWPARSVINDTARKAKILYQWKAQGTRVVLFEFPPVDSRGPCKNM